MYLLEKQILVTNLVLKIKNNVVFVLVTIIVCLITACEKEELSGSSSQEQFDLVPCVIDDNLYRFGVNTNPYEFFNLRETIVPVGYNPFYITAYLRHGARGNVGIDYTPAVEALTKAQKSGLLSEEGERAFRQIQMISGLDNGTDGNLTKRGAEEHRQIAKRIYNKYNVLFKRKSLIRAVSSTSPRCLESMTSFIDELKLLNPQLEFSIDSSEKNTQYLSSSAPTSVKLEATNIYNEYSEIHKPDTTFFASNLFNDVKRGREAIGGAIENVLTGTIPFAAISGAFDLDKTLINLFNVDDLKHYSRKLSQYLYLTQCNSVDYGDRRMSRSQVGALVKDFLEKADTAIMKGDCIADLRFGHDSQLLAFCSKIGVVGIGERLTKDEAVFWPGWLYIPFSANFYMVFYKNGSGDVLVKCFINERETKLIGLAGGPYYAWDELKNYLYSIWNVTDTRGIVIPEASSYPDVIFPQE